MVAVRQRKDLLHAPSKSIRPNFKATKDAELTDLLASAEEQSASAADQSKSTVADSDRDSYAESDYDSCDSDFKFNSHVLRTILKQLTFSLIWQLR